MKQHKFFQEIDWTLAENRQLTPVPYKPNPMKYRYLLQNTYPIISSIKKEHNSITPIEETGETKEIKEEAKKVTTQRFDSPTKRNLLGDLTIYRINKEFENF